MEAAFVASGIFSMGASCRKLKYCGFCWMRNAFDVPGSARSRSRNTVVAAAPTRGTSVMYCAVPTAAPTIVR